LNLEEAQYVSRLILLRQIGPTAAGRRLMDGLIGLMDEWFPGPLEWLPRSLMYTALDEQLATVLGLPPIGRSGRAMIRMTGWGRSWRRSTPYARWYRKRIRWVGDRWLEWWARDYQEVPPYRRGGTEAVRSRMPASVVLTIRTLGDIEDVAVRLESAGASARPGGEDSDDDGYEGLTATRLFDLTAGTVAELRQTVRRVRDAVSGLSDVHRAEITVDGRVVPVGQLTDAEIDALFPA